MNLDLVRFSGVVVGQAHNPTILNPDFLAAEGIVPKSWGWEVEKTFTTPPFALVRYSNGVNITVEGNKLQVSDQNAKDGPEKSKVTEIASAYVRVLRHVRYTAVGNNFESVVQLKSPDTYIKQRFLKPGLWNSDSKKLDALGVRLIYPLDNGRLTVSIDTGEAKVSDKSDKQLVIIINSNFSRNCGDQPAFQQVVEFLRCAPSDWAENQQLLSAILKEAS